MLISWPALVVRGPGGLRVLHPQLLVAADEVQVVVAQHRAGQQVRLGEDLEAVADAEDRHTGLGLLDDGLHHRREAGDGAGPQIVAVGEAAGQDHGVDLLAGPCRGARAATGSAPASRTARWVSRSSRRARESDDADTSGHFRLRDFLDLHGEVLDHGVGEEGFGHLVDAGEGGVVDRPLDLQFESLSLTDVGDPLEAETRQCALHRLALGVEDLRLEHDVDYDACHWHSRWCGADAAVPFQTYPRPRNFYAGRYRRNLRDGRSRLARSRRDIGRDNIREKSARKPCARIAHGHADGISWASQCNAGRCTNEYWEKPHCPDNSRTVDIVRIRMPSQHAVGARECRTKGPISVAQRVVVTLSDDIDG